jgi:hypothetical protein
MGFGPAEWVAILVFGAGAALSTFGKRIVRTGGFGVMALALAGLFLSHYWSAEGQGPIINNAPSINSFNQSGGNNTINVGPSRLPFDPAIGEQLISKLPAGKTILIESVGSVSDQKVADQYQQFLESRGFTVERVRFGMTVPPPDRKIMLGDRNAPKMAVIIAPSAAD